MKKPLLQKVLVLSGLIVLAASPFLVYFGAKFYVHDIRSCNRGVWSFCGLDEIYAGLVIAAGLIFVASLLFIVAVLKKK
jgi:hypothetical protein